MNVGSTGPGAVGTTTVVGLPLESVVGTTTTLVVVGAMVALLKGPAGAVPLVVTGAGAGAVVVVFVMLKTGGCWTIAMLEPQVLTWKFWNSGADYQVIPEEMMQLRLTG